MYLLPNSAHPGDRYDSEPRSRSVYHDDMHSSKRKFTDEGDDSSNVKPYRDDESPQE